jgi:arsenate reductase (thioredoxin)
MAEAFCKKYHADKIEAYSAGIEKHGLNQRAVKVMGELGIDISKNKSKLTSELPVQEFDYVITVCDNANKTCPMFPAKTKLIHIAFDDPPALTKNLKDEEEILFHYRRVRDEIESFVKSMDKVLMNKKLPEFFTEKK